MATLWSTEQVGRVVVATYDNAPMNYFCAQGAQELAGLSEQWRDPSVRAGVLGGGGERGAFLTHYSVEELLAAARDRDAMRVAGTSLTRGYHALLLMLRDLPKPIIVAMNGNTMGGGLELSLACDIRVGQHGDYRYGFPEVRLGIIPGGSGTQRLSRLIGAGRAVEFIMRSRVVEPAVALELGIVHELADDALARARGAAAAGDRGGQALGLRRQRHTSAGGPRSRERLLLGHHAVRRRRPGDAGIRRPAVRAAARLAGTSRGIPRLHRHLTERRQARARPP